MKPTLFDAIQHRSTLVRHCSALVRHDSTRLLNYVALNVESGRTNTELYRTNVEYASNVIRHRSTQFDVRCGSTVTMFNRRVDRSVDSRRTGAEWRRTTSNISTQDSLNCVSAI